MQGFPPRRRRKYLGLNSRHECRLSVCEMHRPSCERNRKSHAIVESPSDQLSRYFGDWIVGNWLYRPIDPGGIFEPSIEVFCSSAQPWVLQSSTTRKKVRPYARLNVPADITCRHRPDRRHLAADTVGSRAALATTLIQSRSHALHGERRHPRAFEPDFKRALPPPKEVDSSHTRTHLVAASATEVALDPTVVAARHRRNGLTCW